MKSLISKIKTAQSEYFIGTALRQELKEIAASLYFKKPNSPLINLICSFCEFSSKDLMDLSLNCKNVSSSSERELITVLS